MWDKLSLLPSVSEQYYLLLSLVAVTLLLVLILLPLYMPQWSVHTNLNSHWDVHLSIHKFTSKLSHIQANTIILFLSFSNTILASLVIPRIEYAWIRSLYAGKSTVVPSVVARSTIYKSKSLLYLWYKLWTYQVLPHVLLLDVQNVHMHPLYE